jgi:ABC-2 type transport system permease protein
MKSIYLIARRELHGYLSSPLGYVIVASLLVLNGLAFNALAMEGEKKSFEVLQIFFYYSCGFVAAAGILFSMRLYAEERQNGTLVLLQTSPATDLQLVLGKFAGAYIFLALFICLTIYMPGLVYVNGKITWGHIGVGYLGLFLMGAAVLAIGGFASSLTRNQLLAAVVGGVLVVTMFVCWLLAQKIEGPLGAFIGHFDFFDTHYRSMTKGVLKASTVVYFLSLTYVALASTVTVLSSRRWRG